MAKYKTFIVKMSQNNISIVQTRLNLDLLSDFHIFLFCLLPLLEVFNVLIKFTLERDVFIYDFVVTTLMYLYLTINYQCDTITHLGFYDWSKKTIVFFNYVYNYLVTKIIM